MNELGNKMKEARKKKGMYTKTVAEMIGISLAHYASIEEGKSRPRIETLKKICEVLEIDFDEMLEIGEYLETSDETEWEGKIKEARKKKGMYAKTVAEMSGMSPGQYCKLEMGLHKPKLKTLKEICEILELDFWEMCRTGNYPDRTVKRFKKELLSEKSIHTNDILNVTNQLIMLNMQDYELVLQLVNSIHELTQKEKDTIKFILS